MSIAIGHSVNTDIGYNVSEEIRWDTVNIGIRYGVEREIGCSVNIVHSTRDNTTAIMTLKRTVQSRFIEKMNHTVINLLSVPTFFFFCHIAKTSALEVLNLDMNS